MEYVIIGGDAAGMSAAMQIWKFDQEAKITVYERGDTYSYGQCGLPYYISGEVESTDNLVSFTAQQFKDQFQMNTNQYTEVTKIDPEVKMVTVKDLKSGRLFSKPYDRLLIATGGDAYIPSFGQGEYDNVFAIKTIADAEAIAQSLKGRERVTVIGGGYIGLEMVEAFRKRNLEVQMIVRGTYPGSIFDEDMTEEIISQAIKQGVDLRLNEATLSFKGEKQVTEVVTDKGSYETDLVLLATGLRPNTDLTKGSGIELGVKGAIVVNEEMETNIEDIYAAGDCATHYHQILKENVHIPLGTTANKQGRIAGMNMAGKKRSFKGIVGTSIIQFFDLTLGKVGLNEKELVKAGYSYEKVELTANNIASYYPNVSQLRLKMLYNPDDRKIYGAQIIGQAGVDKRIDLLVVAITSGMTIDELEDLDLSYAPPYNSVWDIVQRASRKAKK